MRDVTLYNEGNPKRLKNGLLNFAKLRALVMMVSACVCVFTNSGTCLSGSSPHLLPSLSLKS